MFWSARCDRRVLCMRFAPDGLEGSENRWSHPIEVDASGSSRRFLAVPVRRPGSSSWRRGLSHRERLLAGCDHTAHRGWAGLGAAWTTRAAPRQALCQVGMTTLPCSHVYVCYQTAPFWQSHLTF